MQTKWFPAHSYNFERGRGEEKIEFIILHWSNSESLVDTDKKFTDSNRLASVHYAIDNSEIHQYVKDPDTAFHCGSGIVDRQSIGIIVTGGVNMPVSEASYQTLSLVIEDLARKYRIPLDVDHVKGHKDITRTFCPGSLDIFRVVQDAKALSPQSVMDKLRSEKKELQSSLEELQKRVDTADARIEEVRLLLYKKDEAYVKKCEDLIFMQMRNEKLEGVLKDLLHRPIFPIIGERIKNFFRL